MKYQPTPDEIRVCSYDLQPLPSAGGKRASIYCSRACARNARNWRRRAKRRGAAS